MKSKWSKFVDMVWGLMALVAPFIALAVVIFIAYKISVSDLPDWFKFWLLK